MEAGIISVERKKMTRTAKKSQRVEGRQKSKKRFGRMQLILVMRPNLQGLPKS
jgi:hypothetical protein